MGSRTRVVLLTGAVPDRELVECLRLDVRGVVPKEMAPANSCSACSRATAVTFGWRGSPSLRPLTLCCGGRPGDANSPVISRVESSRSSRNVSAPARADYKLAVYYRPIPAVWGGWLADDWSNANFEVTP